MKTIKALIDRYEKKATNAKPNTPYPVIVYYKNAANSLRGILNDSVSA